MRHIVSLWPAIKRCAVLFALGALLALPAAARVRPRFGGEIRVETSEYEAPDFIQRLVAETLTNLDARGEVTPGLALRWESQNGDRRWVFHLRSAARLRGTDYDAPLTSSVAANSIRLGLAKAGLAGRVHGAGEELAVEFDVPVPHFSALVADASYGISVNDEHGMLVGTGPYMIQSVAPPRIVLTVNPDYTGGRHYLETLSVLCGRTPEQQWMDLAAHRADLVEVPPEQLRRAQQERARFTRIAPSELVVLVARRPLDPRLRQSFSEVIDRTALLNVIFQKQGEVAGSLLPQWMTGYSVLLPHVRDAAHARQLRAEVNGRATLTVGYDPHDASLQLVAERLALNAREAGWAVQAVARTTEVDWQLVRVPLTSANAAASLTQVYAALHQNLDLPDATLESLFAAEHRVLSDFTAIPLMHLNRAWAASDRLRDWGSATSALPLPPETWVEAKP